MSEKKDHTTAIFAGDFNVKYKDTLYEYIAKRLNIINFDPSNLELGTANFSDHTLTSSSGKPKWIDFIFLRTSNEIRFRRSFLKEPRCLFGQKLDRISDHNPIITVFEW